MFKNILVPVDLRHDYSLQQAAPAALGYQRLYGARLHVVSVVPALDLGAPSLNLPKDFNRRAITEAKTRLSGYVSKHLPADAAATQIVREGSIYREILAVAAEVKADIIIMASRKPSLQTYLLGTNAARVVEHATCSVLVVRRH